VSKVLRILPIVVLGFAPALAQAPGEIGGREGAIEVKVDGRLCDLPRDVEIGGMVRREGRFLRQRRLDRERFWRGAGGRLEQRGDQLAVRHALVELVERVAPWRHIRQPSISTLLSGQRSRAASVGAGMEWIGERREEGVVFVGTYVRGMHRARCRYARRGPRGRSARCCRGG